MITFIQVAKAYYDTAETFMDYPNKNRNYSEHEFLFTFRHLFYQHWSRHYFWQLDHVYTKARGEPKGSLVRFFWHKFLKVENRYLASYFTQL